MRAPALATQWFSNINQSKLSHSIKYWRIDQSVVRNQTNLIGYYRNIFLALFSFVNNNKYTKECVTNKISCCLLSRVFPWCHTKLSFPYPGDTSSCRDSCKY